MFVRLGVLEGELAAERDAAGAAVPVMLLMCEGVDAAVDVRDTLGDVDTLGECVPLPLCVALRVTLGDTEDEPLWLGLLLRLGDADPEGVTVELPVDDELVDGEPASEGEDEDDSVLARDAEVDDSGEAETLYEPLPVLLAEDVAEPEYELLDVELGVE